MATITQTLLDAGHIHIMALDNGFVRFGVPGVVHREAKNIEMSKAAVIAAICADNRALLRIIQAAGDLLEGKTQRENARAFLADIGFSVDD